MYLGWTTAILSGLGLPSFVILDGYVVDSFNGYTTDLSSMLQTIRLISLIFALLGLYVWIVTYIYYSSLLIFSNRVT
jgi:hypothetical protein